jgi:hypothetical protein
MYPRKIDTLKVANAVRVGGETQTYFEAKLYDIELVDPVQVRIFNKRSKLEGYTSLMNAICWTYAKAPEAVKPVAPAPAPVVTAPVEPEPASSTQSDDEEPYEPAASTRRARPKAR